MEYAKFCQLIDEGEKRNVDFKLLCNAFASKDIIEPKAELAKDICAMANNGNITNYIIVGVYDDASQFQSVSNNGLTDDTLQDFCKKSIYPPPKVKLTRVRWDKARPEHENKEFVIIQVGPQKRQTFRLVQEFIQYKERVCFRRNEVWIRRGATSDLATPEEIARLINGESIEETPDDIQRREERKSFSQLSLASRLSQITKLMFITLATNGYQIISDTKSSGTYTNELELTSMTFIKKLGKGFLVVSSFYCEETLTQQLFKNSWRFFPGYLSEVDALPEEYRRLRKIDFVRRIWILPVLSSVPKNRIERILSRWTWTEANLHCFMGNMRLRNFGKKAKALPTSNELLIVDKIESLNDFNEKLSQQISSIENVPGTIVSIEKADANNIRFHFLFARKVTC